MDKQMMGKGKGGNATLLHSSSGSLLTLVALICMAIIIGLLLAINYRAQFSLLQASTTKIRLNLEDRARSISYFLSERENDMRELAVAPAVIGFFENRSLGMTLAYGLKASLNNMARFLAQLGQQNLLGDETIYSQLVVLDHDGRVLATWPRTELDQYQDVSEDRIGPSTGMGMTSHASGMVSFTRPVVKNSQVIGFVRGWVDYRRIIEFLCKDISGTLIVADNGHVVFPASEDIPNGFKPSEKEKNLSSSNNDSQFHRAVVPGYRITLFLQESKSAGRALGNRLVFMISIGVLSVVVFLAAALVLRAGAKNMVLETSLRETARRERAIAEKNEELGLVLEAAQIGTWEWNIAHREFRMSGRLRSLLGYAATAVTLSEAEWQNLLHPDDRQLVLNNLQHHFNGTTPFYSTEHRMRHSDGTWIWVHDAGKVMRRNEDGSAQQAFGIYLDITERRKASQLLDRARREADAIIRNFLDSLIFVDTNLLVTRLNQATCKLLGYGEEELIGKPIASLFHEDEEHINDIFTFYRDWHEAADGGEGSKELRNVELCYRGANGERLPMSFNVSLVKNEQGEIIGVVAGAKDISNLRSALDKIAKQKEFIETMFDVVPAGLLAVSNSQEIIRSNQVFSTLVARWADRFNVGQQEFVTSLVGRIVALGREKSSFSMVYKHNDEVAVFKCETTTAPVLEGAELVISIEDITHERLAEEERRLLATVVEQTMDAVIIMGTDGTIKYVNPAAEESSGLGREDLLGKKPNILTGNLTDRQKVKEMWQTAAAGNTWTGHLRSAKATGQTTEENVTVSPVRNEEGELTHFVAIKRDVTDMITLQNQLLQAQKLEAVGQLSAGIAHEINTPMQYVQNNFSFIEKAFSDIRPLLQILAEEKGKQTSAIACCLEKVPPEVDLGFLIDEVPESLVETQEGINRVVKIVSAMKQFSHPGTSEKVAVDLNEALENTITVCRNEWKYVAEVETALSPDLPLVQCYPDQLNQAILNLIVNAAHAIESTGAQAPDSPGRITVGTRLEGTEVKIWVGDTGGGIPEKVRERIFEPFFTTKEVGKGTGQGLSIVHDVVVNKHDGTITFQTTVGQGTTFTITIPLEGKAAEGIHG